jgi:hypothetical protein
LVEQRFKLGKIDREEYEWQLSPQGPEKVGPFVVYLASEEAAGLNGKIFYVSGGKIALYSEPERKKTIFNKEGIGTVEELRAQVPKLLL